SSSPRTRTRQASSSPVCIFQSAHSPGTPFARARRINSTPAAVRCPRPGCMSLPRQVEVLVLDLLPDRALDRVLAGRGSSGGRRHALRPLHAVLRRLAVRGRRRRFGLRLVDLAPKPVHRGSVLALRHALSGLLRNPLKVRHTRLPRRREQREELGHRLRVRGLVRAFDWPGRPLAGPEHALASLAWTREVGRLLAHLAARLPRPVVAHGAAALRAERRSAALAVDRELPSLLPRGFDVDDLAGKRIERLGRRLLLALRLRHLLARRPRRGSAVDLRPEVEVRSE